VALKPGQTLSEAELFAHCAANLARFNCPRQVRFVEALPRNATGKIHKPTLRRDFSVASEIDKKAAIA
uniref:AMP-binding enzyme n=1 Tax=Pseudomonas canadensis TaxID=915099 RepID=UPI003F7CF8F1